jgi:glutamine amidotransferase
LEESRVCILDYGSGNVASVFNAFNRLEIPVLVSNSPADLKNSTHIVLPGVGSFDKSMNKINRALPLDMLAQLVSQNMPFLGICVGMQVLASTSTEGNPIPGLGYFDAQVRKLPSDGLPIPHIGWNNVYSKESLGIFAGIDQGTDFYFVHSYFVDLPLDSDNVAATTDYGGHFPSVIANGNLFGVQFHPEKSQAAGLKLLSNFARLI